MDSPLYTLFHNDFTFNRCGIAFLVPTSWWQNFVFINSHITSRGEVLVPPLDISDKVNPYTFQNREKIRQELEKKVKNISISEGFVCPDPLDLNQWTMITAAAWRLIEHAQTNDLKIMTFFNPAGRDQYPLCPPKEELCRLWVICSSGNKTRAYLGLIFSKQKLHKVVKGLIRRMGFLETSETCFTFPCGYNPDRQFCIRNLKYWTSDRVPGSLIFVNYLFLSEEELGLEEPDELIPEENESQQEPIKQKKKKKKNTDDPSYNGRQKKKYIRKTKTKKGRKPKPTKNNPSISQKNQSVNALEEDFMEQPPVFPGQKKRGRPRKIRYQPVPTLQVQISTISHDNERQGNHKVKKEE